MNLLVPMAAAPVGAWLRSPVTAIIGLMLLLAIVYWTLTKTVTSGIPSASDVRPRSGEPEPEPDSAPPFEDWDVEQYSYHPTGPEFAIETLTIGATRIALGDTASHVMEPFPCGRRDRLPHVERAWPGRASRVLRTYDLAGAIITFDMDRANPDEPLRLRTITLIPAV